MFILWKIDKNLSLKYPFDKKFCFESITNLQFYKLFRFQKGDFEFLYTKLKLSTIIINRNRTAAEDREFIILI